MSPTAPQIGATLANARKVGIVFGRGDGSFARSVELEAGGEPGPAAIGDLDGDGKNDLVVPNAERLSSHGPEAGAHVGFLASFPVLPRTLAVEDLNMQAHRVRVTIPENHKVTIEVPTEVPAGEAEVILLSSIPAPQAASGDTSFSTRFRPNPALGPIVFHEDPSAPVTEEDWPTDQRP